MNEAGIRRVWASFLRLEEELGYAAVHNRARDLLPLVCAQADETCKGHLDAAFRHDTPAEFVRIYSQSGCLYSIRPEDYIRLCQSHHYRYDGRARSTEPSWTKPRSLVGRVCRDCPTIVSRYNLGPRCHRCTTKIVGSITGHGAVLGYQLGCRCDDCTWTHEISIVMDEAA